MATLLNQYRVPMSKCDTLFLTAINESGLYLVPRRSLFISSWKNCTNSVHSVPRWWCFLVCNLTFSCRIWAIGVMVLRSELINARSKEDNPLYDTLLWLDFDVCGEFGVNFGLSPSLEVFEVYTRLYGLFE